MDQWPEWWKYVRSVEKIKNGTENEIGSVRRITWATALPYSLVFNSELIRWTLTSVWKAGPKAISQVPASGLSNLKVTAPAFLMTRRLPSGKNG